jgi:hypothetical protein
MEGINVKDRLPELGREVLIDGEEKSATLKIQLKADNGFRSKVECRINVWQWQVINKIIETKDFTEENYKQIGETLT